MSRQEAVTVIKLDTSSLPAQSQQVQQAFGQMAKSGDVSAGQIRAAMRTLPAQFTDVATQLAGGQSPFLVLLQQGGQVKDQFGGIGNALRGIGSLLSPAVLGVAGLAALAGLLALAARDADQLHKALALSGNAAGLTDDRFSALAKNISDSSKATQSDAKDIALTLAKEGTVSARVLETMAIAAARVADVSGRTGTEVAADFAKMGSNVADWAAEHNKAWNFITADQYKYIKALQEAGKTEEAQLFISRQITGQLTIQTENLGYLGSAWSGVAKLASSAWQAMLGFGQADTVSQQIQAAQGDLAKVEQRLKDAGQSIVKTAGVGMMARERDELRQRIANLSETQRLEARGADAASSRAQKEQAAIAKLRADEKSGRGGRSEYQPQFNQVMNSQIAESQKLFEAEDARAMEYLHKLNEEREKDAAKRLAAQSDLLQSLVDTNAKANIDIIADDQQRALAQIDLDRHMLQRRIEAVTEAGAARAAAEALADQNADTQRYGVGVKFAKDTALVTREETRDALANAFRDTKNPLRAFGDALGNIVFQRVTTNLANALLTSTFGAGNGFGGGLVGSLFSAGAALATGGASLLPGGVGAVPYANGTNYVPEDNHLALLHKGEAVVPARFNPAAGGRAGGGVSISLSPVINIEARTDQAQVAQLVAAAMQQTQRDMWAVLHARGIA